ncbi:hypothetical protein BDF14DRAFT_1774466 [Spinellus fusiger]|nr:hypothetical protein BDF14DRAFT_1774466 [Spinellus fusiger]
MTTNNPTSPYSVKGTQQNLSPDKPQESDSEAPKSDMSSKANIKDNTSVFTHILPENKELETLSTYHFHWNITEWKSLETRSHSSIFHAGGFSWRVLLFPKGNTQTENISVYLEIVDSLGSLKKDWHVCAQFSLILSNPNDPTNYHHNNACHRFIAEEIDWGFTRYYDIKNMAKSVDKKGPFLVGQQTVLSVALRIIKDTTGVLWHNFSNYDSRKETGYVGIKNQGATCYMNSLLQSLYCTNAFRKSVYQIPTEKEEPTKSVALALQRCFYNLQNSDVPIGTTELTKSFGWDSLEAFMQHDVQEFNRVLQNNMEIKMKNTPADGAIAQLFVGRMKSYIKCINVEYESSRVEDYYDIQLNVKGCKTLEDSFKDYITVETLEGENKYMAEGHGLQDAHKGVTFESFPPVLHLQLKRFEYDFMRDTMVKINDRYEFPEEINLDEFCSDSEQQEPYDYQLHGVLVHSGDLHGGHYFALIRPEKEDKWLRFDDDRVTPVTKKEAFEENFGENSSKDHLGADLPIEDVRITNVKLFKRFTNAYMLVYIRKSKLDEILAPVLEENIPFHLKRRINEEQAADEKRKKDKEDLVLCTKVAVMNDSTFSKRQEFDLATLDDKNNALSPGVEEFKLLKTETISALKQQIIAHYHLEPDKFRLWTLCRNNKILRVDQVIGPADEKKPIEKLREATCLAKHIGGYVKIYLETVDSYHPKLPAIGSDTALLFLKYYDTTTQEITGLGHLFAKLDKKIEDLLSALRQRAGLSIDSAITLYKEIKPTMIEEINTAHTLSKAGVQHGDIVCFQLSLSKAEAKEMKLKNKNPTVPDHFNSVYNRVLVHFKPKTANQSPEIKLVMSRLSTYTAITHQLASAIDADPSRIRLTTASQITGYPKDTLIYSPNLPLQNMIPFLLDPSEYLNVAHLETLPIPSVYYEVLEVSVVDMETKKSVKIILLGPTLRDESTLHLVVSRACTMRELSEAMYLKSKTDKKDIHKLRFYEVSSGAIVKEFSLDQSISELTEKGTTLYAEKIPEEELSMDMENDMLIQVVHYHKNPACLHSIPFRFVLKKGESFIHTKKRLQKRIGISDKEWQKVKVSLIRNLATTILEERAIDTDTFNLQEENLGEGDALGLDHVDKSSKYGRFGSVFDRGIFIRG